jgi:putative hydrolase of the HAD superfamily
MIKAVIFDFDGLIIDTETPWYEVYAEIYREHGVLISMEHWAAFVGTDFDPLTHLEGCLQKPVDRPALAKRAAERHVAIMEGMGLRPGVEEYLQAAKRMKLKIGLASSSSFSWVERFLRQYNLLGYFDCIRTADNVKKVKPDPELYVQAIACLDIAAEEAVAFEDSVNGLRAAKAAGVNCVVVPNPTTAHLLFEGYDLRIDSMDQAELAEVIARISKNACR